QSQVGSQDDAGQVSVATKTTKSKTKSRKDSPKDLKKQIDNFETEWEELNGSQKRHFVKTNQHELGELLEEIEALRGGGGGGNHGGSGEPIVSDCGTGWVEPPRTRDRTTEFKIFDQMVAAMAGGPNDCSKLK